MIRAQFYLARRYLFNHRPGAYGWVIGWLATGSVALGVAALIITLSVMTGFREDIQQKILGVQPHLVLSPFDGTLDTTNPKLTANLESNPHILVWSPYVSGQLLLGRGSQSSGAMLKGIDPEKEPFVANLEKKLIAGNWNGLKPGKRDLKPNIILGVELARNLGARVGDSVWMVTPGSIGISAFSIPKAHIFIVSGLVQSGLYDYDASLAYTDISSAKKLFGMGDSASGIGIRVKVPDEADQIAREIQLSFQGDYWVRSWLSLNKNLFSALKLEKTVMFIILTLVTLVASVMIVSNLLLSITQKTREIGILRAMGANGNTIRGVFLIQGFLMGIVGTFIGACLGMGVSLALAHTNIIRLPADVYYVDRLPIRIDGLDIFMVVFAALIIVLIATLYPADRASRVNPLDAIRYG